MKNIIVAFIITFSFGFTIQETSFDGKYKMVNGKDYESLDGILTISGSKYKKKLVNGKVIEGEIDDKKYVLLLKDQNSKYQAIISKTKFQNDSISFGYQDTSLPKTGGLTVTPDSGWLIRIK